MRTSADGSAGLVKVQTKNPNNWSSSMARAGRISQLKSELNELYDELYTQEPEEPTIIKENRKVEFVINGYKVTVEPQA